VRDTHNGAETSSQSSTSQAVNAAETSSTHEPSNIRNSTKTDESHKTQQEVNAVKENIDSLPDLRQTRTVTFDRRKLDNKNTEKSIINLINRSTAEPDIVCPAGCTVDI